MYSAQGTMSLIENILIFLIIIAVYAGIVFLLHKKNILKKHNISFYGPALMWRTQKGIQFLKNRAKYQRSWKVYGNASILFCFVTMVLMTSLMIMTAWLVFGFTAEQRNALPGPEVALVLPGINPILPIEYLGYILLGLVIAIVVHEFSHGILALVDKIKVKSLGILYLIVPIGAFCEPDEEEVKKTGILSRMRIYAAGPTANFIVVLVSILLFSFLFMSAVQPAADGVSVFVVVKDTPAAMANIAPGMIITSLNNSKVTNQTEFFKEVDKLHAGDPINITSVTGKGTFTKTIIPADRFTYTNNQSDKGKGYLGVYVSDVHKGFLTILKNPFLNFPLSFLTYYSLPLWAYFQGYSPIISPFTDSFIITGPLSVIPPALFWIIINALYWIFWLNLAVSLFNVLPMVPLDGGFLFNDGVRAVIFKLKKGIKEETKEKIVKNISLAISLLILCLILIPFVIKYI
jgi:membrane-associated protease RseP (regulator of RpoE activity)